MFHQCKSPITSYGVIVFRENPLQNKREYLLIRRKDTLGFVDFMRGKYSIYNKEYILNMIKQMTNIEKSRLITEPFSKLWNDLWGASNNDGTIPEREDERIGLPLCPRSGLLPVADRDTEHMRLPSGSASIIDPSISCGLPNKGGSGLLPPKVNLRNSGKNQEEFCKDHIRDPYKLEQHNSHNKFETLKTGVYTKTDSYNLEELIRMTEQKWTEPEWGFPKGRRNYQEKYYDCAVREFCEETGYAIDKLIPLKNIQPFEEIFTGSNYKSYKHKYYVTYMKYDDTLSSRLFQVCEVSESAWMTFDQCDAAIRPYNIEKKRLILAVDKMLSDNCLSQIYC